MRSRILTIYVAVTCAGAGVIFVLLPADLLFQHGVQAMLMIALAVLAGARPVRFSSLRTELVATQPLVLCSLAALGGKASALTAIAGVLGALLVRRRSRMTIRALFNLGAIVVTTGASYGALILAGGIPGSGLVDLLWPLSASTVVYFAINTSLVTLAIGLERGKNPLSVWQESLQWTAMSFFTGLTVAVFLLFVLQTFGGWGLALGLPPCLLMVSYYRTNRERLDEKLRRIDEVETLNVELERTVDELRQALEDVKSSREALRHSEEQLRQSQKMEAIGRLAGGVAHDFNNLLTVISGYTALILRQSGVDGTIQANADEIRKAADRAASLTRQLLAFSRRQVLEPKILDLNAVVESMDKMVRRLIGENVLLEPTPSVDLGRVKADPGQMEQVILNLVVNARDAIDSGGNGGRIAIETGDVSAQESAEIPGVPAGDHVRLSVTDDGCGMDEETAERIFEPFFTTKEEGKGTGLGLSTVYGIVKQSGGWIRVRSKPGEGTTFDVYLPRVEGSTEVAVDSVAETAVCGGTETILLVEDEEQVRQLSIEILEMQGYNVLEAPTPQHALNVVAEHAGNIDLMVTDVVMPGMNGPTLFARVRDVRDDLRVLYMSGYTDRAVVAEGLLEDGSAYLQKPFSLDDLARRVRQILDESPHPG